MSTNSRWHNFWYQSCSHESLGLLRLYTGIALFLKHIGIWGLYRINEIRAQFPIYNFSSEEQYSLNAFYMPVPGFEWLPVPSYELYCIMFDAGIMFLALFLAAGLFTRLVSILLAFLYLYWTLLSQFFYYHHAITFLVTLLILAGSNCGRSYSLDAYLAGPERKKTTGSIFPIRQLQIFISILYFFSFLAKCNSGWWSGTVPGSMYDLGSIKGIWSGIIFKYISFQFVGISTILIEAFLIFGLWFRLTRPLALFLGVFFHLAIDATMGVVTFSYQMLALYLVFLCPQSKATVLYLPDSVKNQRYCRILNLLDWLRRLELRLISSDQKKNYPEFSQTENGSQLTLLLKTPEGEILQGRKALAELLYRLPLTFPLGCFLKLPNLLANRSRCQAN